MELAVTIAIIYLVLFLIGLILTIIPFTWFCRIMSFFEKDLW